MTEGIPYKYVQGGSCVVCGKELGDEQGDHLLSKKTCSSACRQKLHRYRNRVETEWDKALFIIEFYETLCEIDELEEIAITKLKLIVEVAQSVLDEYHP